MWLESWAWLESRGLLRPREISEHVFTLYLASTAGLVPDVGNPAQEKCPKGEAKTQTGEVPSRRPFSEAHGCACPHCVCPVNCSQPAGQLGTIPPWVTLQEALSVTLSSYLSSFQQGLLGEHSPT